MEERSESSKSSSRVNKSSPAHSRKSNNNKKRNGRKNAPNIKNWCEEYHCGNSGVGPLSNMDYRQMFWQQQSGLTHRVQPQNGQRLFAAMSDPSVCGYSAVPMAYTMEPVSVPPIYPLYQPLTRPNYRTLRGRPRRNIAQNGQTTSTTTTTTTTPRQTRAQNLTNGYSSLQENRTNYTNHQAYQNGDYASLPPSANNHCSENCQDLNSEHRRYSDPGLGPADLTRTADSEDSDSGDSANSIITIGKNNKLVLSLVEQMTALRETNSQMFKELHETRTDLECMKSEIARLKRGGTSDYQPGMLSDIVREMREANKVLDEAMITKVNAMVDEQNRQRTMEFEKLREQLGKITEEKDDGYRRIAKLEDAVAALKLNVNNEGREIAAFEEETMVLRRELQEARSSRKIAENHAAKLEKLVDILRKKMNGASNEDTVANIRELVSSGINHIGGAKISTDNIEEMLRKTTLRDDFKDMIDGKRNDDDDDDNDNDNDNNDEDDALSSCDPDSGNSLRSHGRNVTLANDSACSNNNSLVGPVTDL